MHSRCEGRMENRLRWPGQYHPFQRHERCQGFRHYVARNIRCEPRRLSQAFQSEEFPTDPVEICGGICGLEMDLAIAGQTAWASTGPAGLIWLETTPRVI